jgi:hypothetical protein
VLPLLDSCFLCCSFHVALLMLLLTLLLLVLLLMLLLFALLLLRCSSRVVPYKLSFLMGCSLQVVIPHGLFLTSCHSSCYRFSRCCFFPIAVHLVLLLFSCCSFCLVIPLTLLLPSHYSFCTIMHFRYLLTQLLLFFLCYCCYSFHVVASFYLDNMVLPLPLPCVRSKFEASTLI